MKRNTFSAPVVVVIWIAINGAAVALSWDPYPFILLNLAFSTQAAYAAPLIMIIEVAKILSVAATLGLLVAGPPERAPPR